MNYAPPVPIDRLEPPNNLEAEQALLAAIFASTGTLDRVSDRLTPEHFFDPVHGTIYRICLSLASKGKPTTPITVGPIFESTEHGREVGGGMYLVRLQGAVVTVFNAVHYAEQIRETYARRAMIHTGERLIAEGHRVDEEASLADQLLEIQTEFDTLAKAEDPEKGLVHAANTIDLALDQIGESYKRGDGLVGLSTGFKRLDDLTAGLAKGSLILIAARPSMGKTSLARTMAFRLAECGVDEEDERRHILFFSLEMSAEEQHYALLSLLTEIPATRIRRADFRSGEFDRIIEASETIRRSHLWMDERQALRPSDIRRSIRRLGPRNKPSLVVIDYLQLMRPEKDRISLNERVSEISAALKGIAREFDVPVIALSQLSRDVDKREDNRPILSDLRDSGSLEQDADNVFFIYRHHKYLSQREPIKGVKEAVSTFSERHADWARDLDECAGKADVIVAKNRMGPLGTCTLRFDQPTMSFHELEQHQDLLDDLGGV